MEPIKFEPLLKQTIWGGEKIAKFKHLNTSAPHIGESWEVSGVPGSESSIANGPFKGHTLTNALCELKGRLIGEDNYKRFGDTFPLLIKFIDAYQDLSIQVHPDDEKAMKFGLKNGKTEMWYIIDSAPGAKLYNGLQHRLTPEEYKAMVADDTICDALAEHTVHPGDCFFIPAGRIHSIGAGCFLAEIQQTSDATYRIYDFKRKDANGNYRELHTEQAAECIDYTIHDDYRTHYNAEQNEGIQLINCPYFTTAVYDLTEPMTLDYSELDSFVILIGIKGEAEITDNEGNRTTLREGETLLVPASTATIVVNGTFKFLETYV